MAKRRLRPRSTDSFVPEARRATTALTAATASRSSRRARVVEGPYARTMNIRDQSLHSEPTFSLYGEPISSRLLLGTAGYPSPAILASAVKASGAEIVTVSLRREAAGGKLGERFLDIIKGLGVRVLPNTAGCRTAHEAITTAQMARELFGTDWIKLEVIGNDDTLQPDVFGLVEAAAVLAGDGFKVFPYTTEDLSVAERLQRAGCEVIMPWGAPIGSGRGLANAAALTSLARLFSGCEAHHRRRDRSAVTRGAGDGTRLRCRTAQYGRCEGGRSGADGGSVRVGDPGRAARLRSRADAGARHGRAFDAGRGHAVLRSRLSALSHYEDQARPLLPDRARCRLARAHRAARREAGAAQDQGRIRRARSSARRDGRCDISRDERLPACSQRLLGSRARYRHRLHTSRPGRPSKCRP